MNGTDADFILGQELYGKLVRGDALIGLVADVPAMEEAMLDALWRSALRGSAEAFRTLANCYYARLIPIGAFAGVDAEDSIARSWTDAASQIEDDDFLPLQAAMRCYFEAAQLGDRASVTSFAQAARDSNQDNKEAALHLLMHLKDPTAGEQYCTALVQHWLGNFGESARLHLAAAERGDLDAQFELYIYFAQGIGVEKNAAKSQAWLQRAAAGDHPRALYNVGGAYASGEHGEPDYEKAAHYYSRAARRGNGRAAATLGYMILNEEIVGTPAQAIEWLNLADENGYPSQELLDTAGLPDPRQMEH